MKRSSWLPICVAVLCLATLTPARAAKTIDFDALTITDINHAFDSGALTSEKLVQLCLARIQAYDRQGPSLHAVMILNPKAIETARALDAERKAKGPRSPLHGIPVLLKDNYNTFDLPTTGGSVLLERSIPPTQRHFNMANLACYPAINVPNGFSETGSPTNMTFYAQPYREMEILALAKAYQDAAGFHLKKPTKIDS
jgi:Asp-tRNA(Asn)/Glu-tRNA(Gln) amidotransferase A subunit family amidase